MHISSQKGATIEPSAEGNWYNSTLNLISSKGTSRGRYHGRTGQVVGGPPRDACTLEPAEWRKQEVRDRGVRENAELRGGGHKGGFPPQTC